MSVTESQHHLKSVVQQAIKSALVETKYVDEPISFGQAVVTHHFLTQLQKSQQQQQNQSQGTATTTSIVVPQVPTTSLIQYNQQQQNSQSEIAGAKQVIEFPLVSQNQQVDQQQRFGRKKVNEQQATSIKDIFQWGIVDSKSNNQEVLISPSKYKTEQRDNFRYFVDSPSKSQADLQHQQYYENVHQVQNDMIDQQQKLQQDYKGQQSTRQVRISQDLPTEEELQNEDGLRQQDKNKKISKTQSKKRPLTAEEKKNKNMKQRIDNLNSTTRWLPDSAFSTYFGKPAFHIYGKGNTNPTVGGNIYGQYMLTHNVNPECGEHLPQYQQVYDPALKQGIRQTGGIRIPTLPRKVNDEIRLTPGEVEEIKERNPIMPKDRTVGKDKCREKTIKIVKPDLTKQKYFNSKHTTPNESVEILKKPTKQNKDSQPVSTKNILHQIESKDSKSYILHQEDETNKENIQKVKFNPVQDQYQHSEADLIIHESQDIGEADYNPNQKQQQPQCLCQGNQTSSHQCSLQVPPLCQIPTTKTQINELDPKNYQFVPSCWTQRIRPAGKLTYKSENVYNVVTQKEMESQYQDVI